MNLMPGTPISELNLPLTQRLHEKPIAPEGFEACGRKVAHRWNHDMDGGGQALTEIAKCRTEEWAQKIAAALNEAAQREGGNGE